MWIWCMNPFKRNPLGLPTQHNNQPQVTIFNTTAFHPTASVFTGTCDTMLMRATPMMTSSNGNIFRVTGHLCGEYTGPRWRGALTSSLICVWIIGWVNNREAGDLRRYRPHYDVIVMSLLCYPLFHNRLRVVCLLIFANCWQKYWLSLSGIFSSEFRYIYIFIHIYTFALIL